MADIAADAAPRAADDPILSRADGDGIATLTLNRPRAYNALSLALMRALIDALAAIEADRSVKAVILTGAGKGFCAGHDLKELRANPHEAFYRETFETCAALMLAITRLRQPVIAAVHGIATAAGCQLVATCDLAVAAEDSRFATPGVNIGLFCSTPMVALSRAVPRKQAMEMLLMGEFVSADRALGMGLINRAVTPDAVLDEARAIAGAIAAKSPKVLAVGKRAFYDQAELGLEAAYVRTAGVMTRNMLFDDAGEGIDAFLGKRPPVWRDG